MDIKSKMEDLAAIPKKLSGILEMASEGKLKVDIAAKEVTNLANTVRSATDKIVIGLIIASIVIGLSLVLMSQNGAGVLQILTYIIAVVIIIVVAYTMHRRTKREKR